MCPSFVKYHWRYEILKWLPGFELQRIQIIQNEREAYSPNSSVFIIPYEVAMKSVNKIE